MCKGFGKIEDLRGMPQLREAAARWFSQRWGVPEAEYLASMEQSAAEKAPFPRWYAVRDANGEIIAGAGVIANDFHDRKELTPNLCALYVEEKYRCRGIAGALLQRACDDMAREGIETLYLVTDHTSFYERYGWEFIGMAKTEADEEGSAETIRLYEHRQR